MAFRISQTVAVAAAILLGGCAFTDEALFPSLTPPNNSSGTPAKASDASPSAASTTSFSASSGQFGTTGTFVGQKVGSLRNDLQQLQATLGSQNRQLQDIRGQTVRDSESYHGTVAAIEARLQVGTTPGNPILVQQWNEAQGELDRINDDILKMNRLTADVASTSGTAAYLLDSIRAARSLSGAVDEDHRQLRVLEDDTTGTTVLIERLLTELSTDVQRQQQYVSNERNNLNALAVGVRNGQLYGSSLANARLGAAPVGPLAVAPAPASTASSERPLVTIRFDRRHVAYEDALYAAVKGALDRRPNAMFDVVAVAPSSTSPGVTALGESAARRNAESVVRSLSQMGLPSDRMRISSTTSPDANSGEVRVFVH